MSDLGDTYRQWSKIKQDKRRENIVKSIQILIDNKVHFISRNNGVHLIVYHNQIHVDFWPSTGLWIVKDSQHRGRGVRNLLKYIGVL